MAFIYRGNRYFTGQSQGTSREGESAGKPGDGRMPIYDHD
jgi:hypothetical protein